MEDSPSAPRVKRQRVDKAGRFAALAKLKELKGSKNKYEVQDEVDNVYEVVEEREYAKKAKELYGDDWIDDDGTGYAEDGRDFFEDEDEYSDAAPSKSSKEQTKSKKRQRDSDKPVVKGRGSIRNLFSNAVPKKVPSASIKDDEILADILGELEDKPNDASGLSNEATQQNQKIIEPAKIVASVTKKSAAVVAKEYMNSFMNNIKMKESPKVLKNSDDKFLDSLLKPKSDENKKPPTPHNNSVQIEKLSKSVEYKENPKAKEAPLSPKRANEATPSSLRNTEKTLEDEMDFSCLHNDENQFDLEQCSVLPPKTIEVDNTNTNVKTCDTQPQDDIQNLLSNWESICQMDDIEKDVKSNDNCSTSNANEMLNNEENIRFWYWEAWEEPYHRPGEVFLFGRTSDGKSICVRVENVDRVLYLLPREYLLDPITGETTKQKVTLADLYKEFDEKLSAELKLNTFRSRKVTKNFANHSIGINVPQQCDYMEVHYDGKKPSPNANVKYNSIAHIFGAHTTSLERFLLNRKIKGPCWLNLKSFVVNPAPMSWCKVDVVVSDVKFVEIAEDPKPIPPPLTVLTLNVRTSLNTKTMKNEICMISMLLNSRFHIDKPAPNPPFHKHMCGLTRPANCSWPFDLNAKLNKFTATKVFKHDAERSLLSWFLAQYQQIDADLIVTHDAMDCQLDVLAERTVFLKIPQWSRLSRIRMTQSLGKKMLDFFTGRMVCDVKTSAEECIKSRSYDLQTLCRTVLKIKETDRTEVNEEDILSMYGTADGILKLCALTMQDASFILRLMCDLNLMPLALQITNICGNIMTRTLLAGRSERNEYLLLHAFTEKNYIVPDKKKREFNKNISAAAGELEGAASNSISAAGGVRKKAAYAGGLVLDPIRGLYDKYILLMDFNSLYPSIIQEFNICFTTVQQPHNIDELPALPDSNLEQGILPQQLRRLVESRKEVKKLMAIPDLSPELQMQYHIRQMALKLTANSMYGCLGFAQSRFFAQHLAALVTHKGREILTNTKLLVQKINYEVVYGDTDSIMVNTNITDYEQALKIASGIKQSVNKMYKQVELDIDGVFSCLLLLKKKKYAAVKVIKTAKGEFKKEQELKGLDIVRRDWSQLAIMIGKIVLDEVLSDKQLDDKLDAVQSHLEKVKDQLEAGEVPMGMFLITKQLSKAPADFSNSTSVQPHVQVALRMNTSRNRRYKKGDMVDYLICLDGTPNPPTQRAYHMDEFKASQTLKLDIDYYLAHQLHPVITRMVEVLDGTDACRVAEWLGLDAKKYRAQVQRTYENRVSVGESLVKTTLQKYRQCEKFIFACVECKAENIIAAAFKPGANNTNEAALEKCSNRECSIAPHQYVFSIRNQLKLTIRSFIKRFYQNWLVCDDPACNANTRYYTQATNGSGRLLCMRCKNGYLLRQYTERDLHNQLSYFQYMFDLSKQQHQNVTLSPEVTAVYKVLCETVEHYLQKSAYSTIGLTKLFGKIKPNYDEKFDGEVPDKLSESVAVSLDDM